MISKPHIATLGGGLWWCDGFEAQTPYLAYAKWFIVAGLDYLGFVKWQPDGSPMIGAEELTGMGDG